MIFHFINILNSKSGYTHFTARFLTTLLILFSAVLKVNASNNNPKTYRKQADFKIFFPVDNAVLYAEYKKNAILLDKIAQIIDSISVKPNMHFIDFKVCGYSSPDGLESHNILLSIQRMKQIKAFMIKKYGIDPDIIHTSYVAENWQELDSLVRKSNIKRREELLEIIESNRRNDEKERYIRYHFGDQYKVLLREFYPKLRYATMHIDYEDSEIPLDLIAETEENTDTIKSDIVDTLNIQETNTVKKAKEFRPWIAVKNNLLYDLILAPNIEIERWFGKNNQWSIMLEWQSPWYTWHKNSRAYEIMNFGAELRYWFNSNSKNHRWLTGFFMGAYAMSGKYDVEWNSNGNQGEYWSPGLTFGYAHKIAKRWNMEYSIGAGWLSTNYRHYKGMLGNNELIWQYSGHDYYFGPTKAKIALVFML